MTRGKKNEITRFKNLISSDRISEEEGFCNLLKKDLTVLLGDYFDFSNAPNIVLTKNGDKICFNLSLIATGIKSFNIIPK